MSLIIMSFLSWIYGLLMEKDEKHRKVYLILSLVMIAVPLLVIKEYPMFIKGESPEWLIVPIGISFYTLQLISYNVDIFKGKINAEHNYLRFLLFVSFFPQIVQGPIPRYSQLSDQLYKGNKFDETKFVKGFLLILWGFFLKLCIADKAGIIVDRIFDNYPTYQGMYILIAGFLYSIQLYSDFLACTSLAQGVSGLFGIELIDNFKRPYFSTSIKDFWRRWHISLSSWLRDYIYIPLGGNRKGKIRKKVNILLTFIVSGIWHGAGYKYVFWGVLHGLYQVIGDLTQSVRNRLKKALRIDDDSILSLVFKRVITFVLVMLAWIIFRAHSLKAGLSMIGSMITMKNPWIMTDNSLYSLGLSWKEVHMLVFCMILLLLTSIVQERGVIIRDSILKKNIMVRWIFYIGSIIFIMIFGTYGFGFDAQAFIYGGF